MFASFSTSFTEKRTKATLVCGPRESTKSFTFEAAIHWAEEGHRVVYITPAPLNALPCTYHDRSNLSPAAFRLMRFMYLATHEALVEQLVDLHTFADLPSALLIDDLEAYIEDTNAIVDAASRQEHQRRDVRIARLCALITDSTNACSRILGTPVRLFLSMPTPPTLSEVSLLSMYLDNIWYLRAFPEGNDGSGILELRQGTVAGRESANDNGTSCRVFNYRNFADGSLILEQITEKRMAQNS